MRAHLHFRFLLIFILLSSISLYAQRTEPIPYGDMNKWMVREVKESFIIGGKTQYIYSLTDIQDTLKDNTPYVDTTSPWATSSVLAVVSGITKASVTVFPEQRNNSMAARLETKIERVKVLGIININVLASGTLFLGQMNEPITDTKDPQSKLITGIEFSKRPIALQYDYKVITGGPSRKVNGMGNGSLTKDNDMAEVHILLQHRWEDDQGNIYAKRVATGWERFDKTQENWQNAHQLALHYGDISNQSYYKDFMALRDKQEPYYTKNSKGKMVPIQEVEWADKQETVTHLILQFSSSNGGAYIGNTDSRLWIDNVNLVYQ